MSKWVVTLQVNEDTIKNESGIVDETKALLLTLNALKGIAVSNLTKISKITEIETAAQAYECGKMLRNDSEVEIGIAFGMVNLYDYSESRGGAEFVKEICSANDVTKDEIIELCDKHHWAYTL